MKKYGILALVFVLTGALLMGCGCTNQDANNTSTPTGAPTTVTTMPTTAATTEAPTMPTPAATTPSGGETTDHGNGPLEDLIPGATDDTGMGSESGSTEGAMEGRARGGMMPGGK